MVFVLVTVFANFWIWKIFVENPAVFLLVIASCILLYRYYKTNQQLKPLLLMFSALIIFQFVNSQQESLVNLTNDQIRIRDMRLGEYPPVYIKIGGKTVWFPVGYWFEGRDEFRVFTRVANNFSEVIDPNYYFFANHPRERVGYIEFEKFPYILIPFFLYGTLRLLDTRKHKVFLFAVLPIIFTSFLGSKNSLGVISFFPFISVTIAIGIKAAYDKLKPAKSKKKREIILLFLVLFVLVFIQSVSYALK